MSTAGHDREVLRRVIFPVLVLVMHDLVGKKSSAEQFISDKMMLKDIAAFVREWMIRHVQANVATRVHITSIIPSMVRFSLPRRLVRSIRVLIANLARLRAEPTPSALLISRPHHEC